jgi:hypothetical protein
LKNSRSPSGIEITGGEKINSKNVIKTEEEMTKEEININERTIMPNDETMLRTMPMEMKTTMKTITRTLTIRISTIIIWMFDDEHSQTWSLFS